MFRDSPTMKSVSFEAADGLNESKSTLDESQIIQKKREEVTAVIEGGAQGLLETFFRKRMNIPGARFERIDDDSSKITTLKRNKKKLREAINLLPPAFKTTIDNEAA